MSDKTKWAGLWQNREAIYSGNTIKKTDIPKYAKLIVRYNKFYKKGTNAPRFVYCFANGDSAKAITLKTEHEEYMSMVEIAERIQELENTISKMYTREQVQYAIREAAYDGNCGCTDVIVEDYL